MCNAFRANTKLLILNFPHNSTGSVLPQECLQKLVACARSHGSYIFSDEVYRLLELDDAIPSTPIVDFYEKGINLSVMSKAFGLAGLRIGWIAVQSKETLEKITNSKYYGSICNSAPREILALIALKVKEAILLRKWKIIKNNFALLQNFFAHHAAILQWNRPNAGCVAFPRLLLDMPVAELCKRCVEQKGVLLMPQEIYGWKDNHFRIGFGRNNMPQALDRFHDFLTHL